MTITILEGLGNAMPKKKYVEGTDGADIEQLSGLRQRHGGVAPKRRGGFLDGGEGGNDDRRHQQSSTQPHCMNVKGAPLLFFVLFALQISTMALFYSSVAPQKCLCIHQSSKSDAISDAGVNENPPGHNETADNKSYNFPESKMMHKWLDGLKGIEIGASAHNGFGLDTTNVDYTANVTVFSREQIANSGRYRRVDIIAPGNYLPFADGSVDFVISSHAIEHFHDPIGAICEWLRVVKTGGYVATIAPHKERTFDIDNNRTTLQDLLHRHEHPIDPKDDDHHHWSVWITEDFIEMCQYMGWNVVDFLDRDDKVGNGFAVVIKATETSRSKC